jgi:hypothetical protein
LPDYNFANGSGNFPLVKVDVDNFIKPTVEISGSRSIWGFPSVQNILQVVKLNLSKHIQQITDQFKK